MIAVDTNIIIRLFTKDDAAQYKKAYELFEQPSVFISTTILQEVEWVLRFCYEFSNAAINQALTTLVGLPNVELDKTQTISAALKLHQQGLDFSDALHLTQATTCDTFYTFDKKFIHQCKNNPLYSVQKP